MAHQDTSFLSIKPSNSIKDALKCMNCNECGIVVVVNDDEIVMDTITDGDIRRALLKGIDLKSPVSSLLNLKKEYSHQPFITAPCDSDVPTLLTLFEKYSIHQIPLVDKKNRLIDIALIDDFLPSSEPPLQAVIMAGGRGLRLRPLTDNTPKPMLEIGDKPLLERIILQIRETGIKKVDITTHYKKEIIEEYFSNGEEFGINIQYIHEIEPLGTGGFLSKIKEPDGPILIINGDILTQVDFSQMYHFHKLNNADMTVGVRRIEYSIPYGVVECEGEKITNLSEKPVYQKFVNAGIYILEPIVFEYLPDKEKYNITDVIQELLVNGKCLISFPIYEYWCDIGQKMEYKRAQADISKNDMVI